MVSFTPQFLPAPYHLAKGSNTLVSFETQPGLLQRDIVAGCNVMQGDPIVILA